MLLTTKIASSTVVFLLGSNFKNQEIVSFNMLAKEDKVLLSI